MKFFAALYRNLDETNSTNQKINLLSAYFQAASSQDKMWALFLFGGGKIRRVATSKKLQEWCCELSEIPFWLFEECYQVAGDLAETIAALVNQTQSAEKPLSYYISLLNKIATEKDEKIKKNAIIDCWQHLDKYGRFVFNKLITGGFRIGVSQQIVLRALAQYTGIQKDKLMHRLMGAWHPDDTDFYTLISEERLAETISVPYPFCLAHPLEDDPAALGDIKNWIVEWKWDGIRGQLIFREDELFVWSRGDELITESFPEFLTLKQTLKNEVVLDGEILPYKNGQILDFNVLQRRIGREKITPKLMEEVPVIFMVYDILEVDGRDLRRTTLENRKSILKKFFKTTTNAILCLAEEVVTSSWQEAAQHRSKSREITSEGLMIKAKNSLYESGRKRGVWWKWKIDPYIVDGVLIYAQSGHGRRANLYTDYTFAVWNDAGELVPFTKAYSGLSDEEIIEVDNFIKKNTREKFGPVRSVHPALVFEVAFEGIQYSSRHKSGIALRFPRILRWRKDKKIEDAGTLEELRKLIG